MSEWIECSDGLPEHGVRVRIAGYMYNNRDNGFWTTEAVLRNYEWYEDLEDSEPLDRHPPTHWQKLGPSPAGIEEPAPDISLCPNCGGPADNGHDRCVPPSPYFCAKCMVGYYPAKEDTK